MCIGFIYIFADPDSKYEWICFNNRDEIVSRKTLPLHVWSDGIIAAKDVLAGGTWLGCRKDRFAFVTNARQGSSFDIALYLTSAFLLISPILPILQSPLFMYIIFGSIAILIINSFVPKSGNLMSRGMLTLEFLRSKSSSRDFTASFLYPIKDKFDGFNFVYFDGEQFRTYNNLLNLERTLKEGKAYSISNGSIKSNWVKMERGKKILLEHIEDLKSDEDVLKIGFNLLSDSKKAWPWESFRQQTGKFFYFEYMFSGIFVSWFSLTPRIFGTTTQTVAFKPRGEAVQIVQRSFDGRRFSKPISSSEL